MGTIKVSGIHLHAYHGCLPEEAKLGGKYIVDVTIRTDFFSAEKSDKLSETIDYCEVSRIVKEEMAIRSKLIEKVCRRMLDSLAKFFPDAHFEVKLTKLRPPIDGTVDEVSVTLEN